jgi:hypothetical protein
MGRLSDIVTYSFHEIKHPSSRAAFIVSAFAGSAAVLTNQLLSIKLLALVPAAYGIGSAIFRGYRESQPY